MILLKSQKLPHLRSMIKKDIEHVKITTKPHIHDHYWIAFRSYVLCHLLQISHNKKQIYSVYFTSILLYPYHIVYPS